MSEVDLTVLAKGDDEEYRTERRDSKGITPMEQINSALKECGFGWFHLRMLCASYLGFCAGVLVTNTTPYILPNAECDLDMNLIRKGILTAVPYVGMVCSSIGAGFLVDTFGRKIFLVGGYAMMAFFNIVGGLSQNYAWLCTAKFCEGIVFATAFNPTITFTAEFCHNGIRDRVLLLQSSFASTSQVTLAGISWLVLMKDWRVTFFDGFVLHTWNFYLLLMTLYSLGACILYSFLPESPKYLVNQHRYDEAREVLIKVYKANKRKPIENFSHANLWKDKTLQAIDERGEHPKDSLSKQLSAGLQNVKPLFKKPYVHYLMLFNGMIFCVMLLYNVVRMWYPQLSTVVEHYATPENQELCTMLDAYTNDLRSKALNVTTDKVCVPAKSGPETYMNSIILGSVCLTPYFITGALVNKVGKKYLIIAAGTIVTGVILGLRWSSSKVEVVALFAVAMALAQVMMSLLQASTMQFFPTSIRTLAVSIIMTVGRLGSLLGNVVFPILLDMACEIPFYCFGGVMLFVTLLAIIQPTKKK